MRRIAAAAALASLVLCAGCRLEINEGVKGNGDVVTETRAFEGIDAVALRNQGDLIITLGDREELIIQAESNLIELLETEVDDGTLVLREKRGVRLRPTKPIRFALTVRSLEGIRNSASGDITAPRLRAERMDIRLSGSGDLDLRGLETGECVVRITGSGDATIDALEAVSLAVRQSGSGDLEIGVGAADSFEAHLSGSGGCRAPELRTRQTTVRASGSGGISVHVEDDLEGHLSGSGGVRYSGDPKVDVSSSGSGRARRL